MKSEEELSILYSHVMRLLTRFRVFVDEKSDIRDRVLDLRGAISYRVQALMFHRELMVDYWPKIQDWITPHFGSLHHLHSNRKPEKTFLDAQDTLLYLFDDIVFNAISLCDYFGNLFAVLHFGQHLRRKKWKGIVELITKADESENAIYSAILRHQSLWVDDLMEYRAQIIHYDRDETKTILYGLAESHELYVETPKDFVKRMDLPKDLSKNKQPPHVLQTSEWLLLTVATAFNELLMLEESEGELGD